DCGRLDRFFGQRGERRFLFQPISEGLHLSQEPALLVTHCRQMRNEAFCVPPDVRPILVYIKVAHNLRSFYATFYARVPLNTRALYAAFDALFGFPSCLRASV